MFSLKHWKIHLIKNTCWTTMVELIAVLAIMGMGIAAMLATIGSGIDYARDTENNIKAINLAREGIEWIVNIRDTNWLRFSSDVKNCWRILNYQWTCIGNNTVANNAAQNMTGSSYVLYAQNGLWFLSWVTTSVNLYSTNWTSYKNIFRTYVDNDGYFSQTGTYSSTLCNNISGTGCTSPFTREILVDNITNTGTLQVTSTVRWIEKRPREVIIKTTLTNWKSNF